MNGELALIALSAVYQGDQLPPDACAPHRMMTVGDVAHIAEVKASLPGGKAWIGGGFDCRGWTSDDPGELGAVLPFTAAGVPVWSLGAATCDNRLPAACVAPLDPPARSVPPGMIPWLWEMWTE